MLQGTIFCDEIAFRDCYEVLRVIGCGGCFQVKLAHHFLTGAEVVVKDLSKDKGNILVHSELNMVMDLEHPM